MNNGFLTRIKLTPILRFTLNMYLRVLFTSALIILMTISLDTTQVNAQQCTEGDICNQCNFPRRCYYGKDEFGNNICRPCTSSGLLQSSPLWTTNYVYPGPFPPGPFPPGPGPGWLLCEPTQPTIFDEYEFDSDEINIEFESRENELNILYNGLSDVEENITSFLVRYHSSLNMVDVIEEVIIPNDDTGSYLDNHGVVPFYTPGGDYRIITCAGDDCSLEWALENLYSDKVKMSKFSIEQWGQFGTELKISDDLSVLESTFEVSDKTVSTNYLNFSLSKENSTIPTVQHHSLQQVCAAEFVDSCAAVLNLWFPYTQYDIESETLKIYQAGAYTKEKIPGWTPYLHNHTFDSNYEIRSAVGYSIEDFITFDESQNE